MGAHGGGGETSGHSGVAGGMRRRPIDPMKKVPLIRSAKELELDDDTLATAENVRDPPRPPDSAGQALQRRRRMAIMCCRGLPL